MKRTIYFLTSAPINKTIGKHDVYNSYDLVSKGVEVADLTPQASQIIKEKDFNYNIKKAKVICSAPLGQTLETAKLINSIHLKGTAKLFKTDLLNGVKFSMQHLISKEDFLNSDYEKVIIKTRQSFIENLFDNNLIESKNEIVSRIENLLIYLRHLEDEIILCIGHAFHLKLLFIFLNNPSIFDDKELLTKWFKPQHKPFGFLDGFLFKL